MSKKDIIKAWKDEDFRDSLSDDKKAALPDNPAGSTELSESDLENVNGAITGGLLCSGFTIGDCETILYGDCATNDFFTTGCCS